MSSYWRISNGLQPLFTKTTWSWNCVLQTNISTMFDNFWPYFKTQEQQWNWKNVNSLQTTLTSSVMSVNWTPSKFWTEQQTLYTYSNREHSVRFPYIFGFMERLSLVPTEYRDCCPRPNNKLCNIQPYTFDGLAHNEISVFDTLKAKSNELFPPSFPSLHLNQNIYTDACDKQICWLLLEGQPNGTDSPIGFGAVVKPRQNQHEIRHCVNAIE